MRAIYKRELRSYFTGFTGYLFLALMLLFAGIYVSIINLTNAYIIIIKISTTVRTLKQNI